MRSIDYPNPEALLRIEDLTIAYDVQGRSFEVLHGISLDVDHGQTLGIVGESGSGKTTLALGILGYLPQNGRVCHGSISFAGENILSLSDREKQNLWGSQIAYVPQDPLSSLNPSLTVGKQMMEGLLHHSQISSREAQQRVIGLLELVQIPNPALVFRSYPHQLSGGMQQRILIAMALSLDPQLLVLDEPTTNLDVTTQAEMLDLIQDLVQDRDTTILYVTHNLGVVAQICDRVAVLYAGEMIEEGPTKEVLREPIHPYTHGLLESVPTTKMVKTSQSLQAIQGRIPLPTERSTACVFLPRCPIATERCQERPSFSTSGVNRKVRCHRWKEIANHEIEPAQPQYEMFIPDQPLEDSEPILELDSVKVHFPVPRSISDYFKGAPPPAVRALDGINFSLSHGQTLGIVGESGSGKTTLAKTILGLVQKDEGRIDFLSIPLPNRLEDRDRDTLQNVQMIFQNPEQSLNPTMTVGHAVQRPLKKLLRLKDVEIERKSSELLEMVHLPQAFLRRLPWQLSGGEIQRVAVARAFASNPKLLLADEPVSALDVSVQASILNLLMQLQQENATSTLFISHDIMVVSYVADLIAVMYMGRIMEITAAQELFSPPMHPYTEALISAIPLMDRKVKGLQIRLGTELPNSTEPFKGCPFFSRCPRRLEEICQNTEPPWQELHSGKRIYCHIPGDELRSVQGNRELDDPNGESRAS